MLRFLFYFRCRKYINRKQIPTFYNISKVYVKLNNYY